MKKYLYLTKFDYQKNYPFDENNCFNKYDYFDFASKNRIWLFRNSGSYFQPYEFRTYQVLLNLFIEFFQCDNENDYRSLIQELSVFKNEYAGIQIWIDLIKKIMRNESIQEQNENNLNFISLLENGIYSVEEVVWFMNFLHQSDLYGMTELFNSKDYPERLPLRKSHYQAIIKNDDYDFELTYQLQTMLAQEWCTVSYELVGELKTEITHDDYVNVDGHQKVILLKPKPTINECIYKILSEENITIESIEKIFLLNLESSKITEIELPLFPDLSF